MTYFADRFGVLLDWLAVRYPDEDGTQTGARLLAYGVRVHRRHAVYRLPLDV